MMNEFIDLQIACQDPLPVTQECIIDWITLVLNKHEKVVELTLRFVDIEEMTALNTSYRHKEGPTNVLAFPSSIPAHIPLETPYLGDVIVCPQVLKMEAQEQQKNLVEHWAHIIIHGVLHLLGYDHIKENDEMMMKSMEIELLKHLGFGNPYVSEGSTIE